MSCLGTMEATLPQLVELTRGRIRAKLWLVVSYSGLLFNIAKCVGRC